MTCMYKEYENENDTGATTIAKNDFQLWGEDSPQSGKPWVRNTKLPRLSTRILRKSLSKQY